MWLGIDAGGTKTAAVLVNGDLDAAGRGQSGPCNAITSSSEAIVDALSESAWMALTEAGASVESVQGICVAAAGVSSAIACTRLRAIAKSLFPDTRLLIASDYHAAYMGAVSDDYGIILCAGTGAIAYGRNAEGKDIRLDGRGYALGDSGSGFDIGRMAIRRTIWRLDMKKPQDRFDKWLLSYTGCHGADMLVEWTYSPFSPGRLAEIGGEVCRRAERGDRAAATLVRAAGKSLRATALQLISALDLDASAPVYMVGGLWSATSFLESVVRGRTPELNLLSPRKDPAWGAARLASAHFRDGETIVADSPEAAYTDP